MTSLHDELGDVAVRSTAREGSSPYVTSYGTILDGLRSPLMHLVRNAVHHGVEPRDERVRVGKPAQGRVEVVARLRGAQVEVAVEDDGRGLDLAAIGAQAAARGLYVPVDPHALESGADAYIPKSESLDLILIRLASMLRRWVKPVDRSVPLAALLAVDDNATYLKALELEFVESGFRLVTVASGTDALARLGQEAFDAVLLDLMMPGLSGQETCRRIKSSPAIKDIPVIILTGLDDHQTLVECMDAGADDFISKSMDYQTLRARLRVQLRRRQQDLDNQRVREAMGDGA